MPPVVAATSDLAIVRFHGRNNEMWERRDISPSMRFRYRYTDDELREWVPKVNELADSGREVHLLMNNCYRDQAVDNAAQLAKLLTG
jgi:uncharacterized protein YecE (DUF72 family)